MRRSFARLLRVSRLSRRRLAFPATAPFLFDRFERLMGHAPRRQRILGTPLPIPPAEPRPGSEHVLMVGRLDLIKRPWIFWELARALPSVRCVVAGDHYARGWDVPPPDEGPPNLTWLGNVEGEEKDRVIRNAIALVNTSVHEALPLSFCEVLHHAKPLVGTVEAGGITSRFGMFVPDQGGTGLDAVPRLAEAVSHLVDDAQLREDLGERGRAWVSSVHTVPAFIEAMISILEDLGEKRGVTSFASLLD